MPRPHLLAILVLLLAVPGQGAAQTARPLAPASAGLPGLLGFHVLFRSPAANLAAPIAAASPPANRLPGHANLGTGSPGAFCRAAIFAAERRHNIPAGLLAAIGLVESGRHDPASGTSQPWPWAVNIEGRGMLLDSRDQALAAVRQAQAAGARSIDVGCLQVNLLHHPGAFATLEQGFEPLANADYAARFLRSLKEGPGGGDWMKAAGFYHSQTPDRAGPYRARVQAALGALPPGGLAPAPALRPAPSLGGGGQFLSNRVELAAMLPSTVAGRGLDAYRQRPVPVASNLPVQLAARAQATGVMATGLAR